MVRTLYPLWKFRCIKIFGVFLLSKLSIFGFSHNFIFIFSFDLSIYRNKWRIIFFGVFSAFFCYPSVDNGFYAGFFSSFFFSHNFFFLFPFFLPLCFVLQKRWKFGKTFLEISNLDILKMSIFRFFKILLRYFSSKPPF